MHALKQVCNHPASLSEKQLAGLRGQPCWRLRAHLRTASNLTLAWVGAFKDTADIAGHLAVVRALLDAGADYTVQQRRRLLRVERTSSLALFHAFGAASSKACRVADVREHRG